MPFKKGNKPWNYGIKNFLGRTVNKILVNCIVCKKDFKIWRYELRNGRKFCSKHCSYSARIGYHLTKEQKEKISIANKGRKSSQKTIEKFRKTVLEQYRSGKRKPIRYWLGKRHTKRGKKSHFWKHGNYERNKNDRKSIDYTNWRRSVFCRDNYKCLWCGEGGYLEAHHIKQFAKYPELRFNIDNGITLCRECHNKTKTYGNNK